MLGLYKKFIIFTFKIKKPKPQTPTDVNSKLKYCYANQWCYGGKPDPRKNSRYSVNVNDVMDLKSCCALKGAGGWGLSGSSCLPCPNAPIDDDAGDFTPDLPRGLWI